MRTHGHREGSIRGWGREVIYFTKVCKREAVSNSTNSSWSIKVNRATECINSFSNGRREGTGFRVAKSAESTVLFLPEGTEGKNRKLPGTQLYRVTLPNNHARVDALERHPLNLGQAEALYIHSIPQEKLRTSMGTA